MEAITRFAVVICLFGIVACMPSHMGEIIPNSVFQFGNMIGCTTGLGKARALLDYNGYGCYCGLGGSGTALDETDECCVKHDSCYDNVMQSGLCFADNQVYAIDYEYEWDQCGASDVSITCKKSADYTNHKWPECAEMMCDCDRQGAICFKAERGTFDKNYKGHDKSLCV